jgi:hypothetical protein
MEDSCRGGAEEGRRARADLHHDGFQAQVFGSLPRGGVLTLRGARTKLVRGKPLFTENPRRGLLGFSGIGSLGLQPSDCSIYYKLGKEAFRGPLREEA